MERAHSEEPTVAIAEALRLLELTFRLQGGFRQGFIRDECFTKEIEIPSGTGTRLAAMEFQKDQLDQRFHNLVLSALSTLAIAVDKALDSAFGSKVSKNTGDAVVSLRAVFYMLRCAWAHDVINPKWHRYAKKYEGVYLIVVSAESVAKATYGRLDQERSFEFNFVELNGQYVDFRPFGGIDGIFCLAVYAQDLVANDTDPKKVLPPPLN